MKKLNVILLTVVASVLMLTSCSPYEEGPAISLRSRTERLCNEWRLTRLYINGTEQTLSSFDQQTTLEFKDNGTVNYSYAVMDSTAIVITGSGTWEFNNDQTEVFTTITYTLGGTEKDTFKILRLKEEELWFENNEDGDVVETHYEPK
ncbi:MAG TPA: lipocalin family protein [Bacteroidales bacterium]|nr:lipocalin family protein [Bacteroidales bacterium]HOV55086.1 lipocalin family protein [Bacteroidales bacterium]HPX46032.1 lipocalin family protein [Bacteroidales bacterium]HRC79444.1 lipocalin family protein [Bacteroidales bacterium]